MTDVKESAILGTSRFSWRRKQFRLPRRHNPLRIKETDDVIKKKISSWNQYWLFILAGLRVNSQLVASCEFDVGLLERKYLIVF